MSAKDLRSGSEPGTRTVEEEKKRTGILRSSQDDALGMKHPSMAFFKQTHASSSFKLGSSSPKGGSLSAANPSTPTRKSVKVVGADQNLGWEEDEENKEEAKKQFRKMAARRASCPHNVMSPKESAAYDEKESSEEDIDRWAQLRPSRQCTELLRSATGTPARAARTCMADLIHRLLLPLKPFGHQQ
jgi:hypothetical protein